MVLGSLCGSFPGGQAPTADDYVCGLTGDCPAAEDSSAETDGRPPPTAPARLGDPRLLAVDAPTTPPPKADADRGPARPRHRRGRRAPSSVRPSRAASTCAWPSATARPSLSVRRADPGARLRRGPASRPQLASVRVRIEGHTDSSGGRCDQHEPVAAARPGGGRLSGQPGHRRQPARGPRLGFDRPLPGRTAGPGDNRRVEAARIS